MTEQGPSARGSGEKRENGREGGGHACRAGGDGGGEEGRESSEYTGAALMPPTSRPT